MSDRAQIKLTFSGPEELACEISYQERILLTDALVSPTPTISSYYLFPWFLNALKCIFRLPLSTSIDMKMVGKKESFDPLLPILQKALNILQETRKALFTYQPLSDKTQGFTSKLFLNLGDVPFLTRLYEKARTADPEHSHYDPCHFLNDVKTDVSECVSMEGLVKTILEKKIRTIFVHNLSYLRFFLEAHQILLPILLERMGIELVIVDFDIYCEREGEYLQKKLFNHSDFRRFGIMPHIDAYWDREMGLKNIQPFTLPFEIEKKNPPEFHDYDILITSWARLPHIFHFMKPILLFLSYIDFSKPFLDFQIFFHELTAHLKKQTLPLHKKMRAYTLVSEMYYHTNSLLKFEVIQGMKTHRKIELYGQEDWKHFFPEYYQGQADQNGLNKMLSEKPYLQILMNANYNYFENNPMFSRLLNSNNPYLGFSSVLRTADLEGMSELEFSSLEELNHKIDRVPQLVSSPQFNDSKRALADTMNLCIEDFYQTALTPSQSRPGNSAFQKVVSQYEGLLEEALTASSSKNFSRIQDCLDRVLREDFHHFRPEDSPLISRPYFQKMTGLFRELQPL